MGRITFEGNFCDIAMCRENPCPYNGMCSQRETWERLKKYEDAEKEGHLVMLPCKVGDHVLADGREAIVVWFFGYKTERYLHAQFLDNAEYTDIPFCEIGKTVFLTRQEAEEAMAQEGGTNEDSCGM